MLLPLIYTNTGAALLFLGACLVWNVPEAIGMYRRAAGRVREAARVQDQNSLRVLLGLLWLGLALNFILAAVLPQASISWHRTALFLLGITLILLGEALRWYAIWTLGPYFTRDVAVSENQTVVTAGPYRWIRHPAYSGTFVTALGVGLCMTNWASLAALLTGVVLGHLYRVRVEEAALRAELGRPYVTYQRHTKRFIPWVY